MLARFCQLKTMIFIQVFFFISCSMITKTERKLITSIRPHWFKVDKKHAIQKEEVLPHLIFDTKVKFTPAKRELNVVVTTPKNSEHAYDIDLLSGQRYYVHSYCEQNDIWKNYKKSVYLPPFSQGYIPKVLDQLGSPQKVIIWSTSKNIEETYQENFQRVRLIGAYVEQICPVGNCVGVDNWQSRLVFMGVDAYDPDWLRVKNLSDFYQKIDWDEMKAHLENIDGHHLAEKKYYPFKRVGVPIEYDDAFEYFKKRAIFLKDKELKNIQRSCHRLYNDFLDKVGRIQEQDQPSVGDLEEMKKKLKDQLKLKEKQPRFILRLSTFLQTHFEELATCEKFVYHGNININKDDFWFLSYMGFFIRLHDEGLYYDCRSRSWRKNTKMTNGKWVYELKKELGRCTEEQLNSAFSHLNNFLTTLRKGNQGDKVFYRFIDYDNGILGTHSKMYSWIKEPSTELDCRKKSARKASPLVPEDAPWIKRYYRDVADKLKIIY